MTRSRTLVGIASSLLVAVALVGLGPILREPGADASTARGAVSTSTTSTVPSTTLPQPTTTTQPPSALTQPAPRQLPDVPPEGIGPGDSGDVVAIYQQRLVDLKLDPGPVDGKFGLATQYAVQAVQKRYDADPTGRIDPATAFMLGVFRYPEPRDPGLEADRVEIDVEQQLLTLYKDGEVQLISTISTGSGERYCYIDKFAPTRVCELANTPSGRYAFREFRSGWDKSPLGELYNPWYFNGGIAVHGYPSVPTRPASHGCVRIPMHTAEYFHKLVRRGEAVYVWGGTAAGPVERTPVGPDQLPEGHPALPTTTTVPPPTTAPPATTTPPTSSSTPPAA